MSTWAYAVLTNKREAAPAGTSQSGSPGVKSYVDMLAALVPAEVLTLHAVIISLTTKVNGNTTTIVDAVTLGWAFWGLLIVAVILYAAPRLIDGSWDKLDWLRALIPPAAFLGWTMLQRSTAFDAVCPGLAQAPRSVFAVFLAVLLGVAAVALSYKADQKPPPKP